MIESIKAELATSARTRSSDVLLKDALENDENYDVCEGDGAAPLLGKMETDAPFDSSKLVMKTGRLYCPLSNECDDDGYVSVITGVEYDGKEVYLWDGEAAREDPEFEYHWHTEDGRLHCVDDDGDDVETYEGEKIKLTKSDGGKYAGSWTVADDDGCESIVLKNARRELKAPRAIVWHYFNE